MFEIIKANTGEDFSLLEGAKVGIELCSLRRSLLFDIICVFLNT
jgi:hypothetical protein